MLRANVSPSTITGIEVSGQDQPFGQNAYSRTSQQTYRDVGGVAQDTWTIGSNKMNEFRFQYARRGLSYFYNTEIPGGSEPAVKFPALRISDASPTPTFTAPNNATSSRTISPGLSVATTRSSAWTSTTFPRRDLHRELRRRVRFRIIQPRIGFAIPFRRRFRNFLQCRLTVPVFPGLYSGTRQSQRFFSNKPLGPFLAGFLARCSPTLHSTTACAMTSKFPPNFKPPTGSACPPTTAGIAKGNSD